ncbi:MAG: aminopeptidase P family protein [Armatimonadetes bacterium]|nr:aminopeptidase P family protein [Armatimonadota bacterium]
MAASLIAEKLAQAVQLVRESGCDAWMVFDRETSEGGDPVLPLILEGGLTWQSALIVSGDGRKIAVVGNYDAAPIEASGDWDEVIPYVQSIRKPLLDVLNSICGANPKIAVNFSTNDVKSDGLSHGMYLLLSEYLEGTKLKGSLVSAEGIVMALRGRKTPTEIVRIKAAIAAGDEIFSEIERVAKVGVNEKAIYDHAQSVIDSRGLGYGWDRAGNPIVNSGPDSMIGHGKPSADITLEPGHVFHVDLGVVKDGYSSDIQRCWFVGDEVPDDVVRAADAVNAAITAGADALRPGAEGWTVDAAARKSITEAGYDEYMHALGHQVGRVAHDGGAILGPKWQRYGNTPCIPISKDEVYTLELGVMVPDRGYLGLEEIVVVTDDGCEFLSDRQLSIPVL